MRGKETVITRAKSVVVNKVVGESQSLYKIPRATKVDSTSGEVQEGGKREGVRMVVLKRINLRRAGEERQQRPESHQC